MKELAMILTIFGMCIAINSENVWIRMVGALMAAIGGLLVGVSMYKV